MELVKKLKYRVNSKTINFWSKKPLGVAMFHFGRVGSTVVSELLNQHPVFKWDNELFQILKTDPDKIFDLKYEEDWLKILFNRYSRTKENIYGFETKAIQEAHLGVDFLNIDFNSYLDILESYGIKHFILLKRKNMLRQLISIQRAIVNKKHHYHKEDLTIGSKIDFNPKYAVYGNYKGDILDIFKKFELQYETIEKEFNNRKIDVLKLSYEVDIANDPKEAYYQICKFCNILPVQVDVKQIRISKKDILSELNNPEELVQHLKETPYSWMLKT